MSVADGRMSRDTMSARETRVLPAVIRGGQRLLDRQAAVHIFSSRGQVKKESDQGSPMFLPSASGITGGNRIKRTLIKP